MFGKRKIEVLEAQVQSLIDAESKHHAAINALTYRDRARFEQENARVRRTAEITGKLLKRIERCEKFIPASYAVEEHTGLESATFFVVVKNHPILGRAKSQKFPTKGCAEKALKDHFQLLEFTYEMRDKDPLDYLDVAMPPVYSDVAKSQSDVRRGQDLFNSYGNMGGVLGAGVGTPVGGLGAYSPNPVRRG